MKNKIGITIICILLISTSITFSSYTAKSNSIIPGTGNTYYVSKTGDDNNAGTIFNPLKTLQKAANIVNPGDTVYVRGGTYNEKVIITRSGTSNAWITFKNYQNELPIVDGTGINPSYWAGGIIQISDTSYIIIDGFKVQDTTASGICVLRSHYVTVQNCQTYNTKFSGIRACFGEGISPQENPTNIKVQYNTISLANNPKVGQEALTFSGVHNSEINHNTLTSTCTKEGICCKWDCIDITIANNDIATPGVSIYVGSAPNDMASNFIVNGNYCHGSGNGLGISLEKCGAADNFYFYNNIIECRGAGFQFNYENPKSTCNKGPYNINFINNVFNVGGTCLRLNPPITGDHGKNVIIKNNIFKGYNAITINSNQPENEVNIDHNFFATKSNYYGINYLTGDPKWVNPSAGDYRLQPTSPAIGFGIDIEDPSIDFNGNLGNEYNSNETTNTEYKNNPPNKPKITGRINGKTNKEYEYKFISTDPEADNLIYYINWGDDTKEVWLGPYQSGEKISYIHKWSEKGRYTIKAIARDVYGTESNLATHKVNIYTSIQRPYNMILERFPFFEKILNIILLLKNQV